MPSTWKCTFLNARWYQNRKLARSPSGGLTDVLEHLQNLCVFHFSQSSPFSVAVIQMSVNPNPKLDIHWTNYLFFHVMFFDFLCMIYFCEESQSRFCLFLSELLLDRDSIVSILNKKLISSVRCPECDHKHGSRSARCSHCR